MGRRKFNPGDEVRILPEWWDELAGEENSMYNLYVRNGKDHIYIVKRYIGSDIYLEDAAGRWSEDYLVPAFVIEELESEISIDGLL